MFNRWMTILMAIAFLAAASTAAAADIKLGIVDFQKILETSKIGQKVNADLKQEFQRMESDFEGKKKEIEDLKSKLEKEAMVMSREMREEKEIELRVKLKNAQELEKQYRQELMKHEKEAVNELQKEVLEIVQDMGKKEKFTVISSRVGILYSDDAIDLTDRVVKVLDSRHKGGK
ncbi:MAG: OmpH family outer membrane protein [Desulfobacterales bacterium]